jgi:hypothetical protein
MIFTFIKKSGLKVCSILFISLFLYTINSIAQEFLIYNDTINRTMSSTSGFCWIPYPSGAPGNWKSPYDYYNGQIHTRYEVLSVATDALFALQFGIWQNTGVPGEYHEIMESPQRYLSGTGDIAINSGTPNSWWSSGYVDFTRPYDFRDLAIVFWDGDPLRLLSPPDYGGSNEVWSVRDKWFPVEVAVTIVAVAEGHTFSGWNNYIGIQPPVPDYDIDYVNETTLQAVPSTDEYSVNSNMSGAVSGTGVVISVTPGQDLYFRTKAAGVNPASETQHLVVPSRPASPDISIDFNNEQTNEAITAETEYSTYADMSGAISGTGAVISLSPGTDMYFRVKSTASSFKSDVYHLDVPARPVTPDYSIDYYEEKTDAVIPETDEYSVNPDMSGALSGTNVKLDISPGTDLYFITKLTASSFKSAIQHLDVPVRPVAPDYQIDYENEVTTTAVLTSDEYSEHEDFSGALQGSNSPVSTIPGQDLYFRVKSTASSFKSETCHLAVPERPVLSSDEQDTTNNSPFIVYILFPYEVTGFDINDFEVSNGIASNIRSEYMADIIPGQVGLVEVKVKANAVNEGNFASNVLSTVFQEALSNPDKFISGRILVYPNPTNGLINLNAVQDLSCCKKVEIINIYGQIVCELQLTNGINNQINLTYQPDGYYLVKIISGNNILIEKILKH